MLSKIKRAFPAFTSSNYRYYFTGQFISLIGTWLQIVAQGWLVYQLTKSAFLVGIVAACGSLPSMLFSLFGGVIVDRFPKKKILYFTQASSMILAFILGILTILNIINVLEIALLAFILGIVNAIDSPARQSYVIEMVGQEALSSAIALNSGIFNGARVIGPSIAGFLIVLFGVGWAFILNGFSYVAVIIALLFVNTPNIIHNKHLHPIIAIKEGLIYSFSHPMIKSILINVGVVSIFGWSFTTILPVIAKNTFHTDARGFGYLYASIGLGAVAATMIVSAFSKKINSLLYIFGGNIIFTISLMLFTFTNNMTIALPLLFFSGLGLLLQSTTMNAAVQNMVDNNIRGRVMSIYSLMLMGFLPIGNFLIGFLTEKLGSSTAIQINLAIAFTFSLYLFSQRNKIRQQHEKYILKNSTLPIV